MAKPQDNRGSASSAANGNAGRRRRILLGALVFFFGVAVLAGGAFFLFRQWFTGNPRFALRRIELHAHGYFQNNAEELRKILQLEYRRDNLFSLDLAKLRGKVQAIPCVRNCELVRILPDTLRVRISERIPRALLGNPASTWMVDEEGIILNRHQAMPISGTLPVIAGVRPETGFVAGKKLPELASALDLLMRSIRNFPDLAPVLFDVKNPDELQVTFRFQGRRAYRVKFPAAAKNYDYLLLHLQQALINAEATGETRTNINLLFEGTLVFQ